MSDIAIRVENLSKLYRIGAKQEPYRTLRDTLAGAAAAPLRRVRSAIRRDAASERSNEFWALRDVSFEVKRGEVVGIIGRNGAGKSTLLKILSRITEPTGGYADIYGRVGSLLEVGTGFHPELTGRENIYLNGAILGMKRAEIERQFDAIVEFAEVEQFVDTAVKHYSSGMYLRLAFAVAAHLDPEILLVDEVLAVGDAAFQKKCLGKMGEVAKEGRTVLFVSHNMEAILNFCSSCFVVDTGNIKFSGRTEQAVNIYHEGLGVCSDVLDSHILFALSSDDNIQRTRITRLEMLDCNSTPKNNLYTWDDVVIRISYEATEDIRNGSVIIDVYDQKQQRLIVLDSGLKFPIIKGKHHIDCVIYRFPLAAGEYFIGAGIALSNNQWICRERDLGFLRVYGSDVYDLGRPPVYSRMIFAANHTWQSIAQIDG